MRALGLVVLLAMAGEARAQGGAFGGPIDGLAWALGGVDATFLVAATVTGVGTTRSLWMERKSRPWFVFSLIAGTVVTAVGVGVVGGAVTDYNLNFRRSVPHGYGALAAVHLTIGLYTWSPPPSASFAPSARRR